MLKMIVWWIMTAGMIMAAVHQGGGASTDGRWVGEGLADTAPYSLTHALLLLLTLLLLLLLLLLLTLLLLLLLLTHTLLLLLLLLTLLLKTSAVQCAFSNVSTNALLHIGCITMFIGCRTMYISYIFSCFSAVCFQMVCLRGCIVTLVACLLHLKIWKIGLRDKMKVKSYI